MKTSIEGLALDLSAPIYQKVNPLAGQALIADVAALTIESATNLPPEKRIHVAKMVQAGDKVIDQRRGGGDVRNQFARHTEQFRKQSEAGDKIIETLLSTPDGTICIWVSPPGEKYPEGRFDVSTNLTIHGVKNITEYGIPLLCTQQECEQIVLLLSTFTQKDEHGVFILSSNIFNGQSPWAFLNQLVPMEAVWNNIASGETERHNEARLAELVDLPVKHLPEIWAATGRVDFLNAGAKMEKILIRQGYSVSGGGCGESNIATLASFNITSVEYDKTGAVVSKSTEEKHYVKCCGQCGAVIENYIKAGDKCKNITKYKGTGCEGIYRGCG